jgi:hypothetical protein
VPSGEPGGKLPAVIEERRIAYRGHHRTRCDGTNALDVHQPGGRLTGTRGADRVTGEPGGVARVGRNSVAYSAECKMALVSMTKTRNAGLSP